MRGWLHVLLAWALFAAALFVLVFGRTWLSTDAQATKQGLRWQ